MKSKINSMPSAGREASPTFSIRFVSLNLHDSGALALTMLIQSSALLMLALMTTKTE